MAETLESTKEDITVLVSLQEIENERDRLKALLDDIPGRLSLIDSRLEEAGARFKEREEAVSAKRKAYRDYETEIQNRQESIKKSDAKLMSIKNNKEYQAVLKEIDDLKRQCSELEDKMLELLFTVEKEEASLADAKKEFEQQVARIKQEKREAEEEREKIKKRLVEIEADHEQIKARVAPALLEAYMSVRKQIAGGKAVVEVKDCVCQGCFMNIPPQTYNELYRAGTLKYCPFCNRIIYHNGSNQV